MKYKVPFDGCVFSTHPQGSVTQWFAENPLLYRGVCNPTGCLKYHNGIDLVAPWGTPIKAVSTQKIVEIKNTLEGYGKHLRALDERFEWVYGHLSRIDCKIGQTLSQGGQLGLMGNTGFVVSGATPYWKANPFKGTHLHLGAREYQKAQPNLTYESGDRVQILNYNNGVFGSVNIEELFAETPVETEVRLHLTIQSLTNVVIALLKKLVDKK